MSQIALIGSAAVGLALVVLGVFGVVAGSLPHLFCVTLVVLGGLGIALSERASHRRRAPWAYLVAMWGVVAFCAFFTAPEVLELEKVKQVTVDLVILHGPEKARDLVADENVTIRVVNLGACLLFAAPFVALCVCLARGRRDFESTAA